MTFFGLVSRLRIDPARSPLVSEFDLKTVSAKMRSNQDVGKTNGEGNSIRSCDKRNSRLDSGFCSKLQGIVQRMVPAKPM